MDIHFLLLLQYGYEEGRCKIFLMAVGKSILAQTLGGRRHLARGFLEEKFSSLVPLRPARSESAFAKNLFSHRHQRHFATPPEREDIMSILEVNGVKKVYTTRFGGNKVEALKNVNFSVEQGEYVAIMGESGSGKTTLLNILAALDKPTAGKVVLDGQDLAQIKEAQMAAFRRDNLGFVFQDFNLLDTFSVEDNIYLPLVLAGENHKEMSSRLTPIAQKLGISELLKKYPYEISGGQKQRVAVARALITGPKLILADEPTGALDSKATDELLRLFGNINTTGQTILMVTHSVKAASHAGRVLFIKDGEVFHQIYRGNSTNEQLYQKISDTLTMLATGGDRV